MKVDVAVIGGGCAGIAAAVAAARCAATVLMVERATNLGGNAFSAQVHTLCGLYLLRESESAPLEYANSGIPKEIAEALLESGGARGPVRMGRVDVLLHRPEALSSLALSLSLQLPNLQLLANTTLKRAVKKEDRRIGCLELSTAKGDLTVEVGAVVDATGDSSVAFAAGAATEITGLDDLQRPGYVIGFNGVSSDSLSPDGRLALAHIISSAVSSKRLPVDAMGASFREGVGVGELWMTIDLAAGQFDPRSESDRDLLMHRAEELAGNIASLLQKQFDGFRNAAISSHPDQLGIRESRRMIGRYTLTGRDVLTGRRFDEEAALSAWPVELREKAGNACFRFPEEGRPCGIPMDCLRSRDVPNLLAAGRCISSTHEAHAAIRVLGTSLATGEAAGKEAAAMTHRHLA